MNKPLIGITLDSEDPGNYSKFPWYAIRQNYLDSVYKLGGIPFPLFHEKESINDFCKKLDGIIITGGNFDINPKLYGQKISGSRGKKEKRTKFEIHLFNLFIKLKKPILGICGGEQLMNVACGGNLIQDISIKEKNAINHEQINPRDQTSHSIKIKKNSKLFKIIKKDNIKVNSAHHQAVGKLGKNLQIAALAEDETIEAIELNKHPWCIGVQWHPEFLITKSDRLLFKDFVTACIK